MFKVYFDGNRQVKLDGSLAIVIWSGADGTTAPRERHSARRFCPGTGTALWAWAVPAAINVNPELTSGSGALALALGGAHMIDQVVGAGRYRVGRVLARGGMAHVRLGLDVRTGHAVAVR